MSPEYEKMQLEYTCQEISQMSVPPADKATHEQVQTNAVELIKSSQGLALCDYEFGDEFIINTACTPNGEDGFLGITLVPWGEQQYIHPGTPVRAAITETNIPSLMRQEDIYILGASLKGTLFTDEHQGEIRANCNLMVTPLSFRDIHHTTFKKFPDEELNYYLKKGALELRNRGRFAGFVVAVSLENRPLILPEIQSIALIDNVQERADRIQWRSPYYLATQSACIIDIEESK